MSKAELQEHLETSEKLMQSLNETWEEKMHRTQEIQQEREKALEELGITVEKNNVGVHTPKKMPHLVNLVRWLCVRKVGYANMMLLYARRTKVCCSVPPLGGSRSSYTQDMLSCFQ